MKLKKKSIINIRVSEEQKEKIQKEAEVLGMSTSAYLLYLCEHKRVVVVNGGKELAQEIYHLNILLKKYEKYPFIPVQKLRDTVSQSISNIFEKMEEA